MVTNPLEVGNRVLVPRIEGKFTRQETLYLHGRLEMEELFHPASYRILIFNQKQETVFEGPWKEFETSAGNGGSVNARLSLSQLSLGRYRLVVEVRVDGTGSLQMVKDFEVVSSGI